MITLPEVHQMLEIRFAESWDDSTIQAVYDNQETSFTEPVDEPWVHFQVLFGAAVNESRCADGMTYRQSGTVQLYIYVPRNIGSQKVYEIAQKFRDSFINKQFDQVTTLDGFIAPPELISNKFQSRVSIPFTYTTK